MQGGKGELEQKVVIDGDLYRKDLRMRSLSLTNDLAGKKGGKGTI